MSEFDAIPPSSPKYDPYNPSKPLLEAADVNDVDRMPILRGGSDPQLITMNELIARITGALGEAIVEAAIPTALQDNDGEPIFTNDHQFIITS